MPLTTTEYYILLQYKPSVINISLVLNVICGLLHPRTDHGLGSKQRRQRYAHLVQVQVANPQGTVY